MSELWTPARIERELTRAIRAGDDAVEHLIQLAHRAAQAEGRYEAEHAKALLRSEQRTVEARKAEATVRTEGLLMEHLVTEAEFKAAVKVMQWEQSKLDALRSINANVRGATSGS